MQVHHRIFLNTFTAVAALLVAGSWVDRAAAETVDAPPDKAANLEEIIGDRLYRRSSHRAANRRWHYRVSIFV
jgi:hypothetical protein